MSTSRRSRMLPSAATGVKRKQPHPSPGVSTRRSSSRSATGSNSMSTALVPSTDNVSDTAFLEKASALPVADSAFTTAADILSRAYSATGDGFVVEPVSFAEYRSVADERDRRGSKARLFYLHDARLLIVTVPTIHHEMLHGQLYFIFTGMLWEAGLGDDWVGTHATTFRSALGNTSTGEGDSGGRPKSARRSNTEWPVLVMQVGWTQSLASLRCKKDFWFRQSDHQVKIVILVKAFPLGGSGDGGSKKRILIENWQGQSRLQRPGATGTRAHAAATRDSVCLQIINIVWAGPMPYDEASMSVRQDPNNFNVTRGPLKLDFSKLFLRQPIPHTNEKDIIISDSELQHYATVMWLP
ncbi:hypothetical protein SPBR_00801 [Sporothrix brasiliensis 5110]|uniref:Uncharacterized protein n=1 Tax=Sporothrix brasiliensis 5110 TaxID=1398154 RepID=A0A0C2ISW0_9PEZI|nr:uncharacterized protein SPBR_00801 [Sporothrix brasiliensis 5110]KIH89940.1 hypothetical protein SPBR_00801 [Sporothrix brasiliensis 5110]